ncbi:MAG TPA: N-formylglutamate amidohydrolase [Methanoregulaceae archaeon]|nr:N-formylglutamate amidohydrolase [Methanoregulaceae archaeon]
MPQIYPFLISVPHGGVKVPEEVKNKVILDELSLRYYSDPATRRIFDLSGEVTAFLDTDVSRMIVDLNRPPYHLPPRRWDGVVKTRTVDGKPVYETGQFPDIRRIHRLMMQYYFPYHAELDRLLDEMSICLAIDCHSMLPVAPNGHKDAGQTRPLVCLGNNGDMEGNPRKGALSTCPGKIVRILAEEFQKKFPGEGSVALNTPFSGGFISNAHYWHKGIPWIQLELNRSLYEDGGQYVSGRSGVNPERCTFLQDSIREVLAGFWKKARNDLFF